MKKLLIFWVLIEGNNGYTIFKLEGKRVHWVINKDEILEVSVFKNPQVFNIVPIWCFCAGVSIVSEAEQWTSGIKIVEDRVCISLMRGCENSYLEKFVGFLQTLEKVRTKVESGLCINF